MYGELDMQACNYVCQQAVMIKMPNSKVCPPKRC